MTKLLLKLSGVALALTLLITTGCEDDTTDPLGPVLTLADDAGFISEDTTFSTAVTTFSVRLQANVGDNDLNTLTFLVDGVQVAGSEIGDYIKSITSNGSSITANNPLLISGANTSGGTYDIEIATTNQTEGIETVYTFELADEVGETSSASVGITLEDQGTDIDEELSGVLFNQAGPAGTGGLDLDTGDGTGSSAAGSEIRDLGIDCTIDPANAENWRSQIGTINGADMVKVDPSALGENFTFADVRTKEAIEEAYTTGDALSNGVSQNPQCVETAVTDVSDPVSVGDIFAVFANNTYYLIQIDEVNESFGDNDDNYVLSIKY